VLGHLLRLPQLWRLRVPGLALRIAIAASALVAGATLATLTLPNADRLQDHASGYLGVDGN